MLSEQLLIPGQLAMRLVCSRVPQLKKRKCFVTDGLRLTFDLLPASKLKNRNYEAMPLASVEEWRARIGSCWCALGRPFKASNSSGNYRGSFAALSGSAILQAVYALMVMVLALTQDTTVVFVQGVENFNGCVSECQRQIKSELNIVADNDLWTTVFIK